MGANEDYFLESLKKYLNEPPLPLIDQARDALYGHSRKQDSNNNNVNNITEAIKEDSGNLTIPVSNKGTQAKINNQPSIPDTLEHRVAHREEFEIEMNLVNWKITVEATNDPGIGDWIGVFETGTIEDIRQLRVNLSLSHPFMQQFIDSDPSKVEPFVRLATAIGLAEIIARDSGAKLVGEVRRNINQLLKDKLSHP